jgi:hypothetical protein
LFDKQAAGRSSFFNAGFDRTGQSPAGWVKANRCKNL